MNDTSRGALELYPPLRDKQHPFDPPPQFMRQQRDDPIHKMRLWDGKEAWVITRYADGRAVLSDERFSADPQRPGFPEKNIAYATTIGKDRNIRTLDNPEHDIQKRMLVRDFTVKRVEEIRPKVQALVDKLIDEMLAHGPPIDIVPGFAITLPVMVICELLGVPYEQRPFFEHRAKDVLKAPTAEAAAAAGKDLNDFIEKLIDEKLAKPENDLISRLAHEQMLKGHLTRGQLVSIARLMLVAGHDTTAGMISLSVPLLCTLPERARELRENTDPAFFKNAIDELLRYLGSVHGGRRRVATEDVVIGGQLIRAGEGVIVMNNVMDRDEAVFPNAGTVDFRRPNVRDHVAFGFGIHQCLGQLLARMELSVVHSTLWKRIPTLRLAVPLSELKFLEDGTNYEIESVPVAW
jgi:cytochrome P450